MTTPPSPPAHMVLYCLVRQKSDDVVRFLLITKQGLPTYPPTKFRHREELYHALQRILEQDLGLPAGSYFPEEELPVVPNSGQSQRYPGLAKSWLLYPVVISLMPEAAAQLAASGPTSALVATSNHAWWTLDEILQRATEPNVQTIARWIKEHRPDLAQNVPAAPSMDALARHWCATNDGGVRVVRSSAIRSILAAGDRAFNLRVADPYLAYQKQGFGFTWSFFTPKDKQDLHVHGLPAVEIYGVLEGRLQLWHKPINQRGVRTWRCQTLHAGDWAEVEPLNCHFAAWLEPEGLGTVIKAAATGELAGEGKLGVAGKTVCGRGNCADANGKPQQHCTNIGQCAILPPLQGLMEEYAKPFAARDYTRIQALAREAEELAEIDEKQKVP